MLMRESWSGSRGMEKDTLMSMLMLVSQGRVCKWSVEKMWKLKERERERERKREGGEIRSKI